MAFSKTSVTNFYFYSGELMKLLRIVLAVIISTLAATVAAQIYPSKPIRLIVPFPPGGTVDISARVIAPALAEILGQSVVIDNRAGAAGIIGADLVAKSRPDGYTLLMGSNSSLSMAAALNTATPYDPIRDFVPISLVGSTPFVLAVHPSVQAKSMKEFIALAKSKPGQLSMASGGIGQLVGALFQSKTDTKFLDVPYQGVGPAGIALIGGQVDLMFDQLATGAPPAKAGKTRVLAVTSNSRTIQLPDVPTATEAGLTDFVVESITGVLAPAGTPSEIIDRLNNAILAALQQPATKERFATISLVTTPSTPAQFSDYLREDLARWKKVVKDAGIKQQ
jgi:tripartite-type tricarboxylate transporter receptor subunit TctC